MGKFSIKPWLQGLAWLVAGVIVVLNVKLIVDQTAVWLGEAGSRAWQLEVTVIPLTVALGLLLLYVSLHPWLGRILPSITWPRRAGVHREPTIISEPVTKPEPYQQIAIALDFSGNDEKLLTESLRFLKKGETRLMLLHVVESPVARALGSEGEDYEIQSDRAHLETLAGFMQEAGFETNVQLGTGDPVSELARMINAKKVDMVIVGGHGHAGVSDLIHGTVINDLRHQIRASLLIIPLS
jgi:manganese transport protein